MIPGRMFAPITFCKWMAVGNFKFQPKMKQTTLALTCRVRVRVPGHLVIFR